MCRSRLVAAIALLTAFAGCSSADPEEVDALAGKFTASANPLGVPLTEEQAECRARIYLASDLSDEAIEAIKNGEPPAPKTSADVEELREAADKIAEDCVATDDR